MRPESDRDDVLRLRRSGLNASQIARRTGIPRSTLREWLRHPRPRVRPPSVDLVSLPKAEYAYLLGLYLVGDGTISCGRKGIFRLRITMDSVTRTSSRSVLLRWAP
jgi:hypothetical protein